MTDYDAIRDGDVPDPPDPVEWIEDWQTALTERRARRLPEHLTGRELRHFEGEDRAA
jgi:hypothetical protein